MALLQPTVFNIHHSNPIQTTIIHYSPIITTAQYHHGSSALPCPQISITTAITRSPHQRRELPTIKHHNLPISPIPISEPITNFTTTSTEPLQKSITHTVNSSCFTFVEKIIVPLQLQPWTSSRAISQSPQSTPHLITVLI
jgi:hypothetical protein